MNKNTYLALAILLFGLAFSFDLNLTNATQGPVWLWVDTPVVAAILASLSLMATVMFLAREKQQVS